MQGLYEVDSLFLASASVGALLLQGGLELLYEAVPSLLGTYRIEIRLSPVTGAPHPTPLKPVLAASVGLPYPQNWKAK
jgi:hypothetical protein